MNQGRSQALAAQRVWSLAGKTVIYIEKHQIYRILVSDVREAQTGFLATATPLQTHGLPYRESAWDFGAAWEHLAASAKRVAFTYGGWEIYTDPSVAERILAIVADLPAGKTYWDDYASKPIVGNPRFVAMLSPGPIATRVNEFLRYLCGEYRREDTQGSRADA